MMEGQFGAEIRMKDEPQYDAIVGSVKLSDLTIQGADHF